MITENNLKSLTPSVSWRIRSITPLDDYCLSIQFMDGLKGQVDLLGLISEENPGWQKTLVQV